MIKGVMDKQHDINWGTLDHAFYAPHKHYVTTMYINGDGEAAEQ